MTSNASQHDFHARWTERISSLASPKEDASVISSNTTILAIPIISPCLYSTKKPRVASELAVHSVTNSIQLIHSPFHHGVNIDYVVVVIAANDAFSATKIQQQKEKHNSISLTP